MMISFPSLLLLSSFVVVALLDERVAHNIVLIITWGGIRLKI